MPEHKENPIDLLQEALEEIEGNVALRVRIKKCISDHEKAQTPLTKEDIPAKPVEGELL